MSLTAEEFSQKLTHYQKMLQLILEQCENQHIRPLVLVHGVNALLEQMEADRRSVQRTYDAYESIREYL